MIITRRRRKILALVAESPRTVLGLVEVGGFWRGPLYGLMHRFEDYGLVSSHLAERVLPSLYLQRVYTITERGRLAAGLEVDGQGAYLSRECPATGCAGVGPFYRVICEVCSARGCDECLVNDGDGLGYVCDDCRVDA